MKIPSYFHDDRTEVKSMEIMSNVVLPTMEWTDEQTALMSWVSHSLLKECGVLRNGKIACAEIPLHWRKFWDDYLLEIQMERFAGNGSRLTFSFRQEELREEYRSGEPFRLPLARLRPVAGEVFGFGWVDQLACEMPEADVQEPPVSFLTGEMYYISLGPSDKRFKHRELDARFLVTEQTVFDWQRHCFATPQALVRLHLSTAQKEMLLDDPDSELYRLMTREDTIRQVWASWPEAVRSGTDIYLVLDLGEGRRMGLIREELLLG